MLAQTLGIFANQVPVEYDSIVSYAVSQGYTLPSAAQQQLQWEMMDALIDAGIWNDLDAFYVFANDGSQEFGNINWKSPGSFTVSPKLDNIGSVAPTWVADEGWDASSAGSSYLQTGLFVDNTTAGLSEINYALFAWIFDFNLLTSGFTGEVAFRPDANPSYYAYISPNIGSLGGNPYNAQFELSDFNSPAETIVLDGPNKTGLWHIDISGISAATPTKKVFYNGSSLITSTTAADLLPTPPAKLELIFLAQGNHLGYSKSTISFGGLSSTLNSGTKAQDLYTILDTYMTSI
jgi:hypothetical protein